MLATRVEWGDGGAAHGDDKGACGGIGDDVLGDFPHFGFIGDRGKEGVYVGCDDGSKVSAGRGCWSGDGNVGPRIGALALGGACGGMELTYGAGTAGVVRVDVVAAARLLGRAEGDGGAATGAMDDGGHGEILRKWGRPWRVWFGDGEWGARVVPGVRSINTRGRECGLVQRARCAMGRCNEGAIGVLISDYRRNSLRCRIIAIMSTSLHEEIALCVCIAWGWLYCGREAAPLPHARDRIAFLDHTCSIA